MEKFAQSGRGTIYVSVKILFARVAAATILTRKHRWLWPYRSRRAALSARQEARHLDTPQTLPPAHAQLVAGMRINLENHMRAQRNSISAALAGIWSFLLPSLCRRGPLLRPGAFYPPNARYLHNLSSFTASLPFRTGNRMGRCCPVSGSRAFFTCRSSSLENPRGPSAKSLHSQRGRARRDRPCS